MFTSFDSHVLTWSHWFWSLTVLVHARPPDALDLALPLTSWSCMLNFYTWPPPRSCLSKLTCWLLSDFELIGVLGSARPPDVLDLALPMTFRDWLVSRDLIINSWTWPPPKAIVSLICLLCLDLELVHLTTTCPLVPLLALWLVASALHWGMWSWGGMLNLGYLTPRSNLHIPLFTLNVPLLNVTCIFWFAPKGVLSRKGWTPQFCILSCCSVPDLAQVQQDTAGLGSGSRKVEKGGASATENPPLDSWSEGTPALLPACLFLLSSHHIGSWVLRDSFALRLCEILCMAILPSRAPSTESKKRQFIHIWPSVADEHVRLHFGSNQWRL